MTYDCDDHRCPKCLKPFGHNLPAGDSCPDMRKRMRICDNCISAAGQPLLWDSYTILLEHIP